MGKVSLNINGRKYSMGCEDGEEERLMRLGQKLDDRVNMMANQFGQIGDVRLLVMAGITMLDELEDANVNIESVVDERIGDLRKENNQVTAALGHTESRAVKDLMSAALRVEQLAAKLDAQ
ncbi:MAG: cell division protein ZapA [Litorimonas sp.]